jgi:hypothetical protein
MTTATGKKQLRVSLASDYAYQKNLFPIEIVATYPNESGSADLSMIGTGVDGRDYAIKTCSDGKGYVPITELFCYELARALNIATPDFQIVKIRSGELAFGSVWEGGVQLISQVTELEKILSGTKPVRNLKAFISRVFALDLFINNIDRHFGNFLFRSSYNSHIGLAYDFGRAWYEINPFGYEVVQKNSKTIQCNFFARNFNQYDRSLASNALDEISVIENSSIRDILLRAPELWLKESERIEFLNWWGSSEMQNRINTLKGSL